MLAIVPVKIKTEYFGFADYLISVITKSNCIILSPWLKVSTCNAYMSKCDVQFDDHIKIRISYNFHVIYFYY